MQTQLSGEQLELSSIFPTQPAPTPEAAKQIKEREYNSVRCEHCEALYSDEEYRRLERTEYNAVWNFVYRRCVECGQEITPLKTNIHGKIGVEIVKKAKEE